MLGGDRRLLPGAVLPHHSLVHGVVKNEKPFLDGVINPTRGNERKMGPSGGCWRVAEWCVCVWAAGDNLSQTPQGVVLPISETVARQQHPFRVRLRVVTRLPQRTIVMLVLLLRFPRQKTSVSLPVGSLPYISGLGLGDTASCPGWQCAGEVTPVHPEGSRCCGAAPGGRRWVCCTWGRRSAPPATSPDT